MSTLSTNMADLTSCNFPLAILANRDYNFTAHNINGQVKLTWKPSQQSSVRYSLERSENNTNWTTIANESNFNFAVNKISFTDASPLEGKNFYRIKIVDAGNQTAFSVVRTIEISTARSFTIWPNPVKSNLFIRNTGRKATAIVFSETGNKVISMVITPGLNNIDLEMLSTGRYIITMYSSNGVRTSHKILKK